MKRSLLEQLTFGLYFAEGLGDFSPKANTAYYILPGSQSDYTDPTSTLRSITLRVADSVDAGLPPAGLTRGSLPIAQQLSLSQLVDWKYCYEKYQAMGLNPVVYNWHCVTWVIWGQTYFDAHCNQKTFF